MKAAIISDIHGNSPALEAVLGDINTAKPEKLYVLGDVAHGVDPKSCLVLLYERNNCRCIKGNIEHYICTQDYSRYTRLRDHEFEGKLRLSAQVRAEIGPHLFAFVCGWPDYLHESDAYFLHDSPRDRRLVQEEGADLPRDLRDFAYHGRGVHRKMSEDDAQEIDVFLQINRVLTLFCGHTHVPFIRKLSHGTLVNCGSVGQPFGGDPRAAWIAQEDDGSCSIRRVEYDIEKTVALQRGSEEEVRLFRLGLKLGDHPNEIRKKEERAK